MAGCRAIVELQASVSLLAAVEEQPNELGARTGVVTDLIRQWEACNVSDASYTNDIHRRTPGLPLRRYLVARDRSCTMIGCRARARTAAADHTRGHGHGGPTTDDNLGAVCRHDHQLKHEGGCQVHQPQHGYFRWTSRLGRSYLRKRPPVMEPLPEPCAPTQPLMPLVLPDDARWKCPRSGPSTAGA
jgi:HNH endonuclease